MILRTGAMSPFYSDKHLEPSHLLRKVILLFLLVIAVAFGLAIFLLREVRGRPTLYQEIFAIMSMAVVSGFGSRFIIRNQPGFVRIIAAFSAFVVGANVLGFVSDWKYGIGPLEFGAKNANWDGLVQLIIGILLIILIFRAWRRTQPVVVGMVASPRKAVRFGSAGRSSRSTSSSNAPARGTTKIAVPRFSWPNFMKSTRVSAGRAGVWGRARTGRVGDQPLVVKKPARSKPRGSFRRKPHIQLALVEEHRCPYCLEVVNHTDSRGVVECEVCHSLHHKDCWEITGMCQVPHLNT